MKRLIFILCFSPLLCPAQDNKNPYPGFILRGKVMSSLFLLEDVRCHNLTAGLEYRFTRNFSLGMDMIYLQLINEQEVYNNASSPDDYDEYWQHTPRKFLLADARWYLPNLLKKTRFTLYLSAVARYGTQHRCQQTGYPLHENDLMWEQTRFYDYGFMLGTHSAFGERGHEFLPAGFDISMGALNHFVNSDVQHYNSSGNTFAYGLKTNNWMFYMRVNLYVNL